MKGVTAFIVRPNTDEEVTDKRLLEISPASVVVAVEIPCGQVAIFVRGVEGRDALSDDDLVACMNLAFSYAKAFLLDSDAFYHAGDSGEWILQDWNDLRIVGVISQNSDIRPILVDRFIAPLTFDQTQARRRKLNITLPRPLLRKNTLPNDEDEVASIAKCLVALKRSDATVSSLPYTPIASRQKVLDDMPVEEEHARSKKRQQMVVIL